MLLAVSDQFESPNPNPTPINAGPIQSRIIFFTETDLFKTEGGSSNRFFCVGLKILKSLKNKLWHLRKLL